MESLCVMSQELPFLYLPPMFYDMKKDDEREKYQCAINNTKKKRLVFLFIFIDDYFLSLCTRHAKQTNKKGEL